MKNIEVIDKKEIFGMEFNIYGTWEEPLFLAKDIAEFIEHKQVARMIELVDTEEKLICSISASSQRRNMWFLTERGLKQVLANSRKPIGKEILKYLDDRLLYKKTPKQTEFELMLANALDIHINKTNLDWNYCPFNGEDFLLTYDKSVMYEREVYFGKYRVDIYFPKFNLIVEYDEKHHKYQIEEDELREQYIIDYIEGEGAHDNPDGHATQFIRVEEGKEFEGIIKILSYLMYYAFVF